MRVLIIDDDRSHGESLAALLNVRGEEAYFASEIGEASWFLDLFRFDVAVIDYDMPRLIGPEVASELRDRDPRLKAIVMSAHTATSERLEAIGALPFLSKPIQIDALLRLMRELILPGSSSALTLRFNFPLQRLRRPGEE
jgi:DNA-binding NtrC family response regulator